MLKRKYLIPEEELLRVEKQGFGLSALAKLHGCAPSTVRSQIDTLLRQESPRFRDDIEAGAGGDEKFDRLMGERRFEDVPVKGAERFVPASRPPSHDTSLTGCGSALAVR